MRRAALCAALCAAAVLEAQGWLASRRRPVSRSAPRRSAELDEEGRAALVAELNEEQRAALVADLDDEELALVAELRGRLPPGSLAAADEADYDQWIAGQLRLNRIQAFTSSSKEDVVASLRSSDAITDLGETIDNLRNIIAMNNGVRDKARSMLLLNGAWDQLAPITGIARRTRVRAAPPPPALSRVSSSSIVLS